jgi:hypothetical protein
MYLVRYIDAAPTRSLAKTASYGAFEAGPRLANFAMYRAGYIESAVRQRHFTGDDGARRVFVDGSFPGALGAAAGALVGGRGTSRREPAGAALVSAGRPGS